ncbi:MAG: hypothetical protein ACE1Y4_11770 [Lysobacterales bacterium]
MPQTDEVSLTDRQQYWLKHIRACDAAGQTTIEYARVHGINVKTLYSARKALASKGTLPRPQPHRFQKAQLSSRPIQADSQWHIQLPNGVVIAFGGAVDAKSLSLVLSTAASLP